MQALKNRFKEFRRAPKPKSHTQSPKPIPTQPKPKQPSGILDIPETPAREDTTSFQRHNKAIKNEYAKPKRARKMVVLNELINLPIICYATPGRYVTFICPPRHTRALPILEGA